MSLLALAEDWWLVRCGGLCFVATLTDNGPILRRLEIQSESGGLHFEMAEYRVGSGAARLTTRPLALVA